VKNITRSEYFPLILLITVNLVIGLLTLPAYGESWDEASLFRYAERSLRAYGSLVHPARFPVSFEQGDPLFGDHGPAFVMLVVLVRGFIERSGFTVLPVYIDHFIYFLAFQAGVVSMYFISRRWMSSWASFGAVLLFSTQPLLWGHAFINPKDAPFMSFFLTSLALGLWWVDRTKDNGDSLGSRLRRVISPDVLAAALVLGFTTAMRVAAPMVIVLVVLYAALRRKSNIFPRLFAYSAVSLVVAIALWPHLWPAPLERFVFSLLNSSLYPLEIQTLFAGRLYFSDQIPQTYLPVLLGLQLTETTLLLAFLGLVVAFVKKVPRDYAVLLSVWFALPLAVFVAFRTPLFDNFRHVLFILPPLFMLAGTGLDWLFQKMPSPLFSALILIVAIVPALNANIRLHPYQYVYYNSLAGGVQGAYREYQLDYWCVSYREAALYLNQTAPPNASVVPLGPYQVMRFYLRPDLQLIEPESITGDWQDYDYIVVGTRNNEDLEFARYETIFSVERNGAVLSVIKRP